MGPADGVAASRSFAGLRGCAAISVVARARNLEIGPFTYQASFDRDRFAIVVTTVERSGHTVNSELRYSTFLRGGPLGWTSVAEPESKKRHEP
jgi:hypothetical protein